MEHFEGLKDTLTAKHESWVAETAKDVFSFDSLKALGAGVGTLAIADLLSIALVGVPLPSWLYGGVAVGGILTYNKISE